MEHVFWMGRESKAQLCIWAPPSPINLTQSWHTNLAWLEPPHCLIHYEKSCVNHYTTWMTWIAMHMFFDNNTGGKISKINRQFASNLILSILKALRDWCSACFTPGLQLQRQISYTKCLVSDVVSNAQNSALKKRKMDSNP